jgi:hypothetical protein
VIRRVLIFNLLFAITGFGGTRSVPPLVHRKPSHLSPQETITLYREGLIITITTDGHVFVEGQTFDFDISAIRIRISPEEMRTLIDGFYRIDFFALKDRYMKKEDGCARTRMSEVPMMQTTAFTANGKTKSVTRYPNDCLETDGSPYPRDLVALEQQIETMVQLHKR